ncbi:MAG TPA: triose-phosphate isomerase [Acidimicrobiales bacterium]|nr:triose-phosphate isomerase [Acidimicrobiales bacterium]
MATSETRAGAPTAAAGTPSARRPLVSGNWKMHHDHIEALHTVRDLGLRLKPEDVAQVDVSVHPPFTDLRTVQTLVEGESIPVALGAQHCNDHDRGAYTGEVSPQMLARLGVRYVLVGHSERRQHFAMTDEAVAATLRAVLRHEMTPVLCIGETAEERTAGHTELRLSAQLDAALRGLDAPEVATMVVAYEPIWAIGSGNAATAVDAEDACLLVRHRLRELAGADAAASIRVLYGGSVTPENAAELTAEPDVDGLLVGGASLEAAAFCEIVRASRPVPAGRRR